MTADPKASEKVYGILKGFSTAMFVTLGTGGRPTARPMHMAHIDEEVGEIWFSTGKGGSLADEIDKEATTLLVFQSSFQSSRMVAAPWESFARPRTERYAEFSSGCSWVTQKRRELFPGRRRVRLSTRFATR